MRTTLLFPALMLAGLAVPVFGVDPVIENEFVRVLVVTVQPGYKTARHEHKMNRVMIYLDAGRQVTKYEGVGTTDVKWKAGEALWSPASGMHVAEGHSEQPVTIVEVELKKPGGSKTPVTGVLDPVKVDPKHYKVEMENEQVRVIRARIGPGESTPLHEHSLPRVVVYLSPQEMAVTTEDGKTTKALGTARSVVWAGQARHRETNTGSGVFEVVVVELKG